MSTEDMLAAVDGEIARLQLIRKLLSGEMNGSNGSTPKAANVMKMIGKERRAMSAEARERIASAQRKRWAMVRKAKKKAARQ